MHNNITINIVKPGDNAVVVPDTSTTSAAPDSGLYTRNTDGVGTANSAIMPLGIVVLLVLILSALAFLRRKKKHASENTTRSKATRLFAINTWNDHTHGRKYTIAGFGVIALVVLAGVLAIAMSNDDSNIIASAGDNLTIKADDVNYTIELGDTPVFAYVPVTITAEQATQSGYTLTAYAKNTDLVSTDDDSALISMVTSASQPTSLPDNTYGLALSQPSSQSEELYYSLPSSSSNAITITNKDYQETGKNSTTTVYYAFYITPDTPYGTYTGGNVEYAAKANKVATVTFDGNGLYFKDNSSQSTNVARYNIITTNNTMRYSHTANINDEGIQDEDYPSNADTNKVITIPGADKLHVKLTYGGEGANFDWVSFWAGSHPEYSADNSEEVATAIQSCGDSTVTNGKFGGGDHTDTTNTVECDISNTDSVTFSFRSDGGGVGDGYGYYAIITGYDANGNIVYLPRNELVGGEYLTPGFATVYRFLGWSENKNATDPSYTSAKDIENNLSLTANASITLYAIWESAFTITYHGNGADSDINMNNVEQFTRDIESTSKPVDLLAPNFKKQGYGFIGWSTDQNAWSHFTDNDNNNDPIIYGPNQTITVDPTSSNGMKLYAVWAPAETNTGGDAIYLQDWQGCSALTATTYNATTGALTAGKNSFTVLTDKRDGNTYTIARLADGNCWMIENLRLSSDVEISTANTNNPFTVDGIVSIINNNGNTSNRLSPTNSNWCMENVAECYNRSELDTDNTVLSAVSPVFKQDFTEDGHSDNFNFNVYSYGNQYNWYSATAGTGTYDSTADVTTGDICPIGWALPVESVTSTKASFHNLDIIMGGNGEATSTPGAAEKWRSFPSNFVYNGFKRTDQINNRGLGGYYWSSHAGSYGGAYALGFYLDYLGIYNSSTYYGGAVRCVFTVDD